MRGKHTKQHSLDGLSPDQFFLYIRIFMCFIIRGVIRVQQDVLKEREKEIEKRGGFIFCG